MLEIFIGNLVYLRKVHNIQQKQLADAIDKAVATISNWEGGKQIPNLMDFLRICEYFNVPIIDMIYNDLSKIRPELIRKLKESSQSNLKRSDFIDKSTILELQELLTKMSETIGSIDK